MTSTTVQNIRDVKMKAAKMPRCNQAEEKAAMMYVR